ncbi:MAG: hypothetical protein ACLFV6_06045 [Spirulinaceae cyanobacterium]
MSIHDEEQITPKPILAASDYLSRFTDSCRLTYSDNTITSIYEGTGIVPNQHPLERQFAMLRVPISGCGSCQNPAVSVIYARFTRPLDEPSPGEVICSYEVFCPSCRVYTSRQFIL